MFFLSIFFCTEQAVANPIDSCLWLRDVHLSYTSGGDKIWNPDSVLVDSCEGSPTFGEYYANRWFFLMFSNYVIDRPTASPDSVIEWAWSDIESNYAALRIALSALETKYGRFYLREFYPEVKDSTKYGSKAYRLRFDEYICADSVIAALKDLSNVADFYFESSPLTIVGSVRRRLAANEFVIYPNPATSTVKIKGEGGFSFKEAKIMSSTGVVLRRQAAEENQLKIDVSGLPEGAYSIICDDFYCTSLKVLH